MIKIISIKNAKNLLLEEIGKKAGFLSHINEEYLSMIPESIIIPYQSLKEIITNSKITNKNIELNKEIVEDIENIYEALSTNNPLNEEKIRVNLVIRPSCLEEEKNKKIPTVINIQQKDQFISYFKTIMYNFYKENCKGSLIIQQLIKPKCSAILTRNKISSDHNKVKENVLIKSNYGFSKSIKEGIFDESTYDIQTGQILIKKRLKKYAYLFNNKTNNIELKELDFDKASSISINEDELHKIIKIFLNINSQYLEIIKDYNNNFYIITLKILDSNEEKEDLNLKRSNQNQINEDDFLNLLSTNLLDENEKNKNHHKTEINKITENKKINLLGKDAQEGFKDFIEIIEISEAKSDYRLNKKVNNSNRDTNNFIKNELKKAVFIAKVINSKINENTKNEERKVSLTRIKIKLDKLIRKYITINPQLKDILSLFKDDFLKEL